MTSKMTSKQLKRAYKELKRVNRAVADGADKLTKENAELRVENTRLRRDADNATQSSVIQKGATAKALADAREVELGLVKEIKALKQQLKDARNGD